MTYYIELLFGLFVGHAVCDVALHSKELSRLKRRRFSPSCWWYFLWGHSLMHGGAAYVVTGNVYLGILETVCHFIIDLLKCEGKFGMFTDQFLHFMCKFLWVYYIYLTSI